MKLPEKERKDYDRYLRHLMSIASRNHTIEIDAKEIIKKAKEERDIELILRMDKEGFTIPQIMRVTQRSEDEIKKILSDYRNI